MHTKCLHQYEPVKPDETEMNNVKTKTPTVSLTPEQIATHNQNAATAVNKLLPPTAKPTVVDKPVTQDSMGGGVELGRPAEADDSALKILYYPGIKTAKEFLQTSDEVRANQKLSGDKPIALKDNTDNTNGYKIITNKKSTVTSFNNLNKATKVENHLSDGTKITSDLHPKSGQKLSTTISTPPVKTGLFSTTKSSTVIQHHDDGTHTATTTTTTSNLFSPLFGKTTSTAVTKGTHETITQPVPAQSSSWLSSLFSPTKSNQPAVKTSTTKSLTGKTLSKSAVDANKNTASIKYNQDGTTQTSINGKPLTAADFE